MNPTNKLLDKFAVACKAKNDSDIGRALRVSPQAVNGWRKERAHPNAEAVEKMCLVIGEPLRSWLPLIEAERARTPGDRKVWLRLAQAAAAVTLTLSFSLLNGQAPAGTGTPSAAHNQVTLYIMSNIAQWFRKLGTRVASFMTPTAGCAGHELQLDF